VSPDGFLHRSSGFTSQPGGARRRRAGTPAVDDRRDGRARLLERLPAFHRESPGLLAPLASVAEEMLDGLHRFLRGEEARLGRDPLRWRALFAGGAGVLAAGPLRGRGTAAAVAGWLEARLGQAPRIWPGIEARPHRAGGIDFHRARHPAAILAWEKEALPEPPAAFFIPEEVLPVAAAVQAVIVKTAHGGLPRLGERLPGQVFWERRAPSPAAGGRP
jgi:hypothetical protein